MFRTNDEVEKCSEDKELHLLENFESEQRKKNFEKQKVKNYS